ncbi:Amidase [Macleaya cordata]|uniref:Amidase n=1 Tax=Macleaya cordata TaxID=56857 RepID=A0A200RAW3_MACCD|nr:Amidase [Macleaya cordata]
MVPNNNNKNNPNAILSLFHSSSPVPFSFLLIPLMIISGFFCNTIINVNGHAAGFSIREASIRDIQQAFTENKLTSRQLVEFYLHEIQTLNPLLRAVIEVNPDALDLADKADWERSRMMIRMRTNKLLQKDHHHHHHCSSSSRYDLGELHGIPVLLKDTIATKDKLNTTAGSYALLGSVVPRDAGVVKRLRSSGALILGKASLSEWASFRGSSIPNGWCARTGQGKNPYVLSGDPCGSSSGSAISVATNMVTVSLGTETDGSILCPASSNSVVGIKPTVGLTSRAGVVPISPRQDTVGYAHSLHLSSLSFAYRDFGMKLVFNSNSICVLTSHPPNFNFLNLTQFFFFSKPRLEIFDGSNSAWDNDVDGDDLETLELMDSGDMQIRDKDGELVWKASDNPIINQNCGSIGAPEMSPALPPFASPIHGDDDQGPFGQPAVNDNNNNNNNQAAAGGLVPQQPQLGVPEQHQNQQEEPTEELQLEPAPSHIPQLQGGGLNQPAPFSSALNHHEDDQHFGAIRHRLISTMVATNQIKALLSLFLSTPFLLLVISGFFCSNIINGHGFSIREAGIRDIQQAFTENKLTSRQLVEFYLHEIQTLNPLLRAVIEVNPDALDLADKADWERSRMMIRMRTNKLLQKDHHHHHHCSSSSRYDLGELHGIPVLLKDTIATKDKLNTTAGSYALLGSVVPRDAGVVKRLRRSGALIMGKASLSEWAHIRSFQNPDGWSARGGQAKNPYVLSGSPCGSSSGSAISVAANMVTVSLGTETHGSILCPASYNSVVGIKPTVGLTSRAGVVPVAPRQDTIGPICRTVSDAVYVLDAIVGFDPLDREATREATKFIPDGGYKQFLKEDGLQGKRLGIVRNPAFFDFPNGSILFQAFEGHLDTLRRAGAVIVDNLEIHDVDVILDPFQSGEATATLAEFKQSLNVYLKELLTSPVRSLASVIAFNEKNPSLEKTNVYDQQIFKAAESTNGIGKEERSALKKMKRLSRDGFERLMMDNELDAMVTPGANAASVLAIGGYPGISVPAGYDSVGIPVGICFGGLRGSEPKLIEIAYAFEQITLVRKPPPAFKTYIN